MKKPLLKICGLRDPDNIQGVIGHQPDFLGFIFYEQSPRFVGFDFVVPQVPEGIRKVGVFVNEEAPLMIYDAKSYGLDLVQLSGQESPRVCGEIKAAGLGVIKVFHVSEGFDFSVTDEYAAVSDYFLFDTRSPGFGGSGRTFDWKLLSGYSGEVPFLLAGGLGTDNLGEAMAVRHARLAGFDLNSGVESAPGMKDLTQIGEVKRILNANR